MTSTSQRAAMAFALLSEVLACATGTPRNALVAWPGQGAASAVHLVRTFSNEEGISGGSFSLFGYKIITSSHASTVGRPTGLALSHDETRLYVASEPQGLVLVFDFGTRRLTALTAKEAARPLAPFAVATDSQDNIYVSDSRDPSIYVYSPDRALRRKIQHGALVRPTGIAIDSTRGLLYVADSANEQSSHHVVMVFGLAGNYVRTVGRRGAGAGEFHCPVFLAVGSAGELYVGDVLNARVQVFSATGKYMATIGGRQAPIEEQFGLIKGLALDPGGNLHVADAKLGVVHLLDRLGTTGWVRYGRVSQTETYVELPTGLAIGKSGKVYVANFAANHITEFVLSRR